jgi:hypothetical protein
MKIIPFRTTDNKKDKLYNGEPMTHGLDIIHELSSTAVLSQRFRFEQEDGCTISPFVSALGAFMVKGTFPVRLLQLWDEWTEENESENERPGIFTLRKLGIIFLNNYT